MNTDKIKKRNFFCKTRIADVSVCPAKPDQCSSVVTIVLQLLVTKYTPTMMIRMPVTRVSDRFSWNR